MAESEEVAAMVFRERLIEQVEQAVTDLRTGRWHLDGTTPASGEIAEVAVDTVLAQIEAPG